MDLSKQLPGRQGVEALVLTRLRIPFKKKMINSVGNPDIRNARCHVVAQHLLGHSLLQRYVWSLAFHQQAKITVSVCRGDVSPSRKTIHHQRLLNTYQSGRHTMVMTQPMDDVLPNPLFRSKADIFFSDCVENIVFLPVSLESVIERRQVKGRQQPQL